MVHVPAHFYDRSRLDMGALRAAAAALSGATRKPYQTVREEWTTVPLPGCDVPLLRRYLRRKVKTTRRLTFFRREEVILFSSYTHSRELTHGYGIQTSTYHYYLVNASGELVVRDTQEREPTGYGTGNFKYEPERTLLERPMTESDVLLLDRNWQQREHWETRMSVGFHEYSPAPGRRSVHKGDWLRDAIQNEIAKTSRRA